MKNIFVIFLFFTTITYSQTNIKGKVSDKNESLAFVSVYILELKKGSESDLQGNYAALRPYYRETACHHSCAGPDAPAFILLVTIGDFGAYQRGTRIDRWVDAGCDSAGSASRGTHSTRVVGL